MQGFVFSHFDNFKQYQQVLIVSRNPLILINFGTCWAVTATTRRRVRQVVQKQHFSSLSQEQHVLHQDQLAPQGGLTGTIRRSGVTRLLEGISRENIPTPLASMVFKQLPSPKSVHMAWLNGCIWFSDTCQQITGEKKVAKFFSNVNSDNFNIYYYL